MMLRSLIGEVVRRRLWPIPLAALLIAVAAPLLFMKSAPDDVPVDAAPAASAPGNLPTRAQKLVATSDQAVASRERSQRRSQDPFAPPASAAKAKDTSPAGAPAATPAASSSGSAGAVVIQNSDGSKATMPATGSATKTATPKKKKTATRKKQPQKAPAAKKKTAPKVAPAPAPQTVTYVDVRFGKRQNTILRHRVPRLQTFRGGGKVAAMFVKYSPSRDKAVFAIAPSTFVSGDVKCRKVNGVCRYVDVPEGEHVRLWLRGENGRVVTRRLDVVHIRRMPRTGNESAARRTTPLAEAICLLKGLLKLPVTLPSISADACA